MRAIDSGAKLQPYCSTFPSTSDRTRLIQLRHMEMHLANACNLTCESCSHYSNQGHKGVLSLEDAEAWMSAWSGRVSPRLLSLLGGEPTINPHLTELVKMARRHFPQARIRIVTNGFFLHRHPTLPEVLGKDPGARLSLSVHHDDPVYREKLKPVFKLIRQWIREHGIRASMTESHTHWTRRYKGFGAGMEPFDDGDPRQSWKVCPAKYCIQLFEGKLWKCGPIAYLRLQDAKYDLSLKWDPYLAYVPLASDCSDQELQAFTEREDESCCNMCPAQPEKFALPIPLRQVPERRPQKGEAISLTPAIAE
jgi:hypothetical protein